MKSKLSIVMTFVLFLAILLVSTTYIMAQETSSCPPDKELCAKMLRFGKEAYSRGKYLDAKEYFRKAVKADPTSLKAWRYYDQAVIFGLAEKVEKDANLVMPDVSTRHESSAAVSPTGPPAPPAPATEKKEESGFKIIEDEGC